MKNNYITIQGWMVSELGLSGNELLAYALIYGFSQDGESKFTGSIKYVQSWLNCSRGTVIKALQSLTDKDLIIKEQFTINNITLNRYKINIQVVQNLNGGGTKTELGVVQNLNGGGTKTVPNNTNTNNNIINNNNNIPDISEFLEYAKSVKPNVDLNQVKLKYQAWKEAGWQNGNGKKIKNWKSNLLNTIPYLKTTESTTSRPAKALDEIN